MVNTPILFITFVRPDYARQTWEGIKAAKPKTLYFYSNKGRAEKIGEVERNNEIRSFINEINWDCDLHTFFRDECVNIYDSLRGAIDWLFENEESGIILEEDCVPTKAFFSFVDQMLVKFKEEERIWCISGDNYVDDALIPDDYFFSHYHYMYGWASWRNRWKKIDWNAKLEKSKFNKLIFRDIYRTKGQVKYRINELRGLTDFINSTKCWDYLFGYTIDINHGLTVHPKINLVTNVGLDGVHHSNSRISPINKKANPFSDLFCIMKHPTEFRANMEVDLMVYKMFQYAPFYKKVISSLSYRLPLYYHKIFG